MTTNSTNSSLPVETGLQKPDAKELEPTKKMEGQTSAVTAAGALLQSTQAKNIAKKKVKNLKRKQRRKAAKLRKKNRQLKGGPADTANDVDIAATDDTVDNVDTVVPAVSVPDIEFSFQFMDVLKDEIVTAPLPREVILDSSPLGSVRVKNNWERRLYDSVLPHLPKDMRHKMSSRGLRILISNLDIRGSSEHGPLIRLNDPRVLESILSGVLESSSTNRFAFHLDCSVLHHFMCDNPDCPKCPLPESDTFTILGLERGTKKGHAQHSMWVKSSRTAVMEVQEKMRISYEEERYLNSTLTGSGDGDEYPPEDGLEHIAFVALKVTHEAKLLARERAIQNGRDVYGESNNLDDSMASTAYTSCRYVGEGGGFLNDKPRPNSPTSVLAGKYNHKGHSVHFHPSTK